MNWPNPARWTSLLLLIGLGLRGYHYLRDSSIWCDEAAVIVNVMNKSYVDLLGPLAFDANGPPLFFWIEKAAYQRLGDSRYVWRFFPFLASSSALLLFVVAARRTLAPEVVPWAVMLLAFSDRLLWHSCEAKPYAVDVFAATAILAIYATTQFWPVRRQLLLNLLILPPLLYLSFPAAFVCIAVLLVQFASAWRENRIDTWLLYYLLGIVLAIGFLILLWGPVHAQDSFKLRTYWARQFPPWERPWAVPAWVAVSFVEMLRYCVKPTGGLMLPLMVAGAVALWRSGQQRIVILALLPIALALAASLCGRYPFGHARVEMYAAPAVALLIAAGVPPAYAWIRQRRRSGAIPLIGLGLLLVAPAALSSYRVICPWPRPDAAGAAAYVMAHRAPTDLVASDGWQFDYYFRSLHGLFRTWEYFPPKCASRVWVVMSHLNPGDELPDLPEMPGAEWHMVERREFTMASVTLLAPEPAAASDVSLPSGSSMHETVN